MNKRRKENQNTFLIFQCLPIGVNSNNQDGNTQCQSLTGAVETEPFCGTIQTALSPNAVSVGDCGQCQLLPIAGRERSTCTSTSLASVCEQGSCASGFVCCASGKCGMFQSEC